MKNIFQCKTVWGIVVMVFLGIGGDEKIQKILTTFELSARDALEIAGGLGVIGGGAYARYKGDEEIHTPKILPGKNKPQIVFDIDMDENPFDLDI